MWSLIWLSWQRAVLCSQSEGERKVIRVYIHVYIVTWNYKSVAAKTLAVQYEGSFTHIYVHTHTHTHVLFIARVSMHFVLSQRPSRVPMFYLNKAGPQFSTRQKKSGHSFLTRATLMTLHFIPLQQILQRGGLRLPLSLVSRLTPTVPRVQPLLPASLLW